MDDQLDRLPRSLYSLRSHRLVANNSTFNSTRSPTTANSAMASASVTSAPQILDDPGSEPPKCYLLSIAAELRNEIYELAFTCNDSDVNLSTTKPPSSALLQTCQQINNEAGGLLAKAVHEYYDDNNFCLILHRKRGSLNPYRVLEEVAKTHDLQRIKNLHVRFISDSATQAMLRMGASSFNGAVIDATLQQNGLLWDAKLTPTYGNQIVHKWCVPLLRNETVADGLGYICFPPLPSELGREALATYLAGLPGIWPNLLVNIKDQIEGLIVSIMPKHAVEKQKKLQANRAVAVLGDY